MYIISEFAVCVVMIFIIAALSFAACATLLLFQEGGVAVGRAVCHIAQRWQQPAPRAVDNAMQQEADVQQSGAVAA